MATTSKPRRKKKVIKKQPTKNVDEPTFKTHLDLEDLRQVENLSKDVVIAKQDMHLEEQSLANLRLEMQLLEQKYIKQREVISAKSLAYKQASERFANYKKQINPKYGLDEKEVLGYNPDTGEIDKQPKEG